MKRIGALWKGKSKSKDGRTYLTGNVEVIVGVSTRLLVIQAKEKSKENSPDYEVFLTEHAMVVDKPNEVDKKPVVSSEDLD